MLKLINQSFANAQYEAENLVSFGQDEKALGAVANGLICIPLLNTEFLRVVGADRLDFVQGQLTNDVKKLAEGSLNQALMLNHKGHSLAQMHILKETDSLLLAVEDDARQIVQKQLQRHIIFDQVELEPLNDLLLITIQGTDAAKFLIEEDLDFPEENQFLRTTLAEKDVIIYPSKRSQESGFDIIVEQQDAAELFTYFQEKGAIPAGLNAAEIVRVLAVIPKAATEGGEGVLPQEAGLEHAISYTKGCYLGQEIMARIEARGNLRRRLCQLQLSAFPDEEQIQILQRGKQVGRLGKVVQHPEKGIIGLAILRKDIDSSPLTVGDVQLEPVGS